MKGFTLEVHRKVYDDEHGCWVLVRPDADALGLVEVDGGKDYGGRLVVPPQMALLLSKAIADVANDMLAADSAV